MSSIKEIIRNASKKKLVLLILCLICLLGTVGTRGYMLYDNITSDETTEKFENNTDELEGRLEDLQEYINTLERSVNESYYALSMSDDDYDKGMAGKLLEVLDTIHKNQKMVGDMITAIHENTSISASQYNDYYTKINSVYMDISEVNIVTGNIVNNIDARVDNYKSTDNANYKNVLSQTEMVKSYSDSKMQGTVNNLNNQIVNVDGKVKEGHNVEKNDLESYEKLVKENHEKVMAQEKMNNENLMVAITNCYSAVNTRAVDNKDAFLAELSNKTTLLNNSLADLESLVGTNKGIIADAINTKNTSHSMSTYDTTGGSTSYEFSQLQKGILHIPYQVVIAGQSGNTKIKVHHHTDGDGNVINNEYVYSDTCPNGCFTVPAGHTHDASCTYEEINGVRIYTCGFPTNIWKAGCGCYDGQILESYTRWDYKSEGSKGIITTEP